jgi:hypothetical protein
MLSSLRLSNVGPAPKMAMDLAPRLNLITGDNGLGKSFLLDVAWWALTRRWPRDINPALTCGFPAKPTNPEEPAEITFALTGKSRRIEYSSRYEARSEAWVGKVGRPWNPGLVLYAHADGGFAVWDPARNYWKKAGNVDVQERLPGFVFSSREVWDGLSMLVEGKPARVCNGLLADWSSWIREQGSVAKNMERVLRELSPSPEEGDVLSVGGLTRMSIDDVRDIPSLRTVHGDVPILHASSGVRRIVALAYMLQWSWREHRIAAKQLGEKPTSQVVMLFDEIESHLHPRWQRTVLQSLLRLTEVMHIGAKFQLIAATHSPLVLASAEPWFDAEQDAWFDLDLVRNGKSATVELCRREFVPLGDVSNWLTSEAFDLESPRSKEGEHAILRAMAALRERKAAGPELLEIDQQLRTSLPEIDPFWVRWRAWRDTRRGSA